jgi:hypothetical protein
VCLRDGTCVLFRPSELQEASLGIDQETEAAFRMLKHPRRDVFEWPGGREIPVSSLPVGLVFDVMRVPGKEVSDVLSPIEESIPELVTTLDHPLTSVLARVRRLF